MKKTIAILSLFIINILMGCGADEKKQAKQKTAALVNSLKPAPAKKFKKAQIKVHNDLSKNYKSIKNNRFYSQEEIDSRPELENLQIQSESNNSNSTKEENKSLMSFDNLKKILSLSKIGQTLDQKQLTENFEIPKEAVKLVKTITKTSEDEIAIKWRSTWFVEKVSDAKFRDGVMKMTFKSNKLYTSGTAI